MIVSIKVSKTIILITSLITLAILVLLGFWGYGKIFHAKVNRNTAVQVTKPVVIEQVQPGNIDFFTEYRIERDKVRGEHSDLIREALKTAKSEESIRKAQDQALKIILEKQRETEMENLIKAKGFADALVFAKENSVSAIVKATVLSREEVMQVADIITRVSGTKAEDITISAKP